MQLSMLDIMDPPPAPVPRAAYVPPVRRDVLTRACGTDYVMQVNEDDPDPFEIEVRGIPCLITRGFSTYTVQPPGSLFWTDTGFRSFGFHYGAADRDVIRQVIEQYIDAPIKDGCGGKLVRWWPMWVREWQDKVSWSLTYERATMWGQWGPERHAEIWATHDAKIAAAEARMWSEGIDPNDVGKPRHHKGKWPVFSAKEQAA